MQALRVQAGNVNTVYYPGTDADTGDFAESSEHMTLDPENTEQLIVTFSAVPRVASDGETAKFLLRGGEQSWECEAEGDAGGGYRGSLTIPMVDEYSVYLVLTDQNGGTRNLLIASESDIENRFSIDVQAYWSSGGPTFSFGKNTFTGTLSTYVDFHDALEDNSFTGRIILYQNGKEIAEQPLEYRSQGGEYGATAAALTADRVDLVDEHDGRRVLLCLLEQVAHAGRADADIQLDKVRARDGQKLHACLARDRAVPLP